MLYGYQPQDLQSKKFMDKYPAKICILESKLIIFSYYYFFFAYAFYYIKFFFHGIIGEK